MARKKFADLLKASARISSTSPVSVAGLVLAWQADNPSAWHEHISRVWIRFQGEVLLDDLTPESLQQLVDEMIADQYAAWTVRHVHALARSILSWAAERQMVAVGPPPGETPAEAAGR